MCGLNFSAAAASEATSSGFAASTACAADFTCAPISAAVASAPSRFLSAQMTLAPSAASASAAALPMPEAAPTISAVLHRAGTCSGSPQGARRWDPASGLAALLYQIAEFLHI